MGPFAPPSLPELVVGRTRRRPRRRNQAKPSGASGKPSRKQRDARSVQSQQQLADAAAALVATVGEAMVDEAAVDVAAPGEAHEASDGHENAMCVRFPAVVITLLTRATSTSIKNGTRTPTNGMSALSKLWRQLMQWDCLGQACLKSKEV